MAYRARISPRRVYQDQYLSLRPLTGEGTDGIVRRLRTLGHTVSTLGSPFWPIMLKRGRM